MKKVFLRVVYERGVGELKCRDSREEMVEVAEHWRESLSGHYYFTFV